MHIVNRLMPQSSDDSSKEVPTITKQRRKLPIWMKPGGCKQDAPKCHEPKTKWMLPKEFIYVMTEKELLETALMMNEEGSLEDAKEPVHFVSNTSSSTECTSKPSIEVQESCVRDSDSNKNLESNDSYIENASKPSIEVRDSCVTDSNSNQKHDLSNSSTKSASKPSVEVQDSCVSDSESDHKISRKEICSAAATLINDSYVGETVNTVIESTSGSDILETWSKSSVSEPSETLPLPRRVSETIYTIPETKSVERKLSGVMLHTGSKKE